MTKRAFYMLGVLSMVVLVTACGATEDTESQSTEKDSVVTQEMNLMANQELGSMDTLFTQDETSIIAQANVFEGLYQLDEKDEIVPAVAKELPNISDDGLTYTIDLREDTTWSNGDPVTAHDFVFAWRRLVDPDNGANYFFLLDGSVENGTAIINGEKKPEELGVKALSDYQLEIKLEKPVAYFTSELTFTPFFPQNEKFVTEQGDDYGTSSENILSNGAFLIENWDQAKLSWQLKKNEKYFDADKVKSPVINFEVIKETATAFNLFEAGDLDVAQLSGDFAQQNIDNPNFQAMPRSFVNYFKLNQERNGKPTIFANENVRKAISLAVDNQTLVDNVLADGSQAIYGFIPKGFVTNPETGVDFREEAGKLGATDKYKAQEYWEKAKKEMGDTIEIELLTKDNDNDKKVAEFIQGQLEETLSGLKISIKSVPTNSSIELTKKGDYDLCVGTWGPDYQDPMTYLINLRTGNNSKYSNPKYDELIKDADDKYANEPGRRWATLIEAERLLVEEDAGIVPIYQQAIAELVNEDVTGIQYHSFGSSLTYKYAYKK